jgi:transcriptional regulator with XRE-family HTH domain
MAAKKRPQYEALMIGKQIRFVRRSKDITQKELAKNKYVQKTVAWIGRIERGEHLANIKMLYKLSQALGVRLKDLIPVEM